MKKFGFTLAEILVTLGVIGVIAALTLPTLTQNTSTARVGPTLAKAVSVFEQANTALLNEYKADSLRDAGFSRYYINAESYIEALSRHMKIRIDDTRTPFAASGDYGCLLSPIGNQNGSTYLNSYFISKDGVRYGITLHSRVNSGWSNRPTYQSTAGRLAIDINGFSAPNVMGSDQFHFVLYQDGSVRPIGGTGWNSWREPNFCSWREKCPIGQIPSDPSACAGHIFENEFKILYR